MERRRFNGREKTALYLAADGRCESCGVELEPGWHADHVQPYSRDGKTDVINGQALCPTCNLKKGNRVSNLREWQREARESFFALNKQDFLVSATPGAGKTTFSLDLAAELIKIGKVERVAVVVPTDALRQQWADNAANFGLSLMPVGDGDDYAKDGYDGCVVTYHQLAKATGSDLLRRTTRTSTLAILDEIHHAGENRAWGDGLTNAVEHAVHRLALTGTPWRRDKTTPIPFVTYDEDGKVVVDYGYEYGAAVADGVCRRVEFHAYDGETRWVDCGKVETADLGADLADEDVSAALDSALDPKNSWIPGLLLQAVRSLDELREEIPDAGGLVIADKVGYAFEYARILANITGLEPTVVVSKDENGGIDQEAKTKLDRFKDGRSPWLVAVKMVSEGVDIPRLAVGVYATKTRTPLFFRQATGRFVRIRKDEDFNARMFIPAIPALMRHALEIENELRHQLDLERERDERERKEPGGDGQGSLNFREPLSASEPVFDRTIFGGEELTPAEINEAVEFCRKNGVPERYAANIANGHRGTLATTTATAPADAKAEPRHRRERVLRGEIDTLAGKLAHRTGVDKKEVNADLLRAGFSARSKASVEQLERIRDYLARGLAQT